MLVYKLLRPDEWAAFDASGSFAGSPDDRRNGYIHLSTADQLDGTRARYFAGEPVVCLTLDADRLGDLLRWEKARGEIDFPHLYRSLLRSDIVAAGG